MAQSLFISFFLLKSFLIQVDSEKLTVEPNHASIGFSIPIAGGMTRVTGKFTDFDLKFNYPEKDLRRSTIVFTIKAASLTTALKERDDHLRTADFFDVEKFPEIIFKSDLITGSGKKFDIGGILSMHGVDKHVTLPVEIVYEDKSILGIQIRWHLNRKEYGIGNNFKHTVVENFLNDEVDIEINFNTKRDKRQ